MDGLVKLSTFIYGAKIIVNREGAHCEHTTAAEKVGIYDPVEARSVTPPRKTAEQAVQQQKAAKKPSRKSRQLYDQKIFRDWCKACGICIAFCPKNVIGRDRDGRPVIERPDDCIGCRFCEIHCPDFAFTIRERDGKGHRNRS
jgi:2-oxoglutarate ferredoxin oxidoreductase subunit delta